MRVGAGNAVVLTVNDAQAELKGLPNYMRQYEAYEHLNQALAGYLQVSAPRARCGGASTACAGVQMNGPMVDLGAGVLRDKHHKMLLKEIGIDKA